LSVRTAPPFDGSRAGVTTPRPLGSRVSLGDRAARRDGDSHTGARRKRLRRSHCAIVALLVIAALLETLVMATRGDRQAADVSPVSRCEGRREAALAHERTASASNAPSLNHQDGMMPACRP
jgi:hypothetical protein